MKARDRTGERMDERCPGCHDVGWVLDADLAAADHGLTTELIPCLLPECVKSGQRIELLSVNCAAFTTAVSSLGLIMSLSRKE